MNHMFIWDPYFNKESDYDHDLDLLAISYYIASFIFLETWA